MGCCPGTQYATEEQKFAVVSNTPCGAITVDLLNIYKNHISCYLQYSLYGEIGSSKAEMESAIEYLNTFIAQKQLDEENCTGIETLPIIRSIADKIIKRGICL